MKSPLSEDLNQWSFNLQSGPQMQEFLYGFLQLKPFDEFNEKGNYSVNEETLLRYANEQDIEFCKLLTNFRKLQKALNTYLQDFYRNLNATTIKTIHPDFWLNTVETYRSCVAKGTYIDCVRDVSKYPKGILIEQVKPGDYVYCYDDKLNPQIKKVLWAGKTGYRKVIRVHWQASKGRTGYLDLTPEHKVRTISGEYVQAKNLLKKDLRSKNQNKHIPKYKVLALSRKENNHIITKIEYINKYVDVYDLEVEDCHNFIANEICVHNSSSDPNEHNLPKHGDIIDGIAWKLMRGLIASKDYYLPIGKRKWLLGEVDYDGAETKVAAIESQDPVLADDLNNDMDQHSHFAIDIFPDVLKGLSYKEVKQKHGDTYRFLTKNSYTFANYYGAIPDSIAREFRKSPIYEEYVRNKFNALNKKSGDWLDYYVKFSVNQITNAQQAFYDRYKKLYEWQINVVKTFYDKGYVENKFGFRRRYPLKKNEIINYPIQSTSFLLLLDSLISIEKETQESGFKSHIFGQVHDSGLNNIYKPEIYDWVEMVNYYMINKDHLPFTKIVNLKVDWDVGYHWDNLKRFTFNDKNQFKWILNTKKT